MGCCSNTNSINDTTFNLLVGSILKTHPLNQTTIKKCRTELNFNMYNSTVTEMISPIKAKSQKLITVRVALDDKQIKYISEDRYIEVLNRLYKVNLIRDTNLKQEKVKAIYNVKGQNSHKNISTVNFKKNIDSESDNSEDEKSGTEEMVENLPLTDSNIKLYLQLIEALSPTYADLFDAIIKDKPESSFILFAMGFTRESFKSKSKAFFKVLELANIKANLVCIRTILQSYLELNMSFNQKIFSFIKNAIDLPNLKENMKSVFNIQLDNQTIDDWLEFYLIIGGRKTLVSSKMSFTISKELLNIVTTNTVPSTIDTYKSTLSHRLNDLSVIEISEQMLNYNNVTEEHFTALQHVHPYLFNAHELHKMMINEAKFYAN